MSLKKLKNKKILFLSWSFYQYPQKIIEILEKNGAEVHYCNSAPTDNFVRMKIFKKIRYIKDKYYSRLITELQDECFDYIFLINAATFPKYFIEELSLSHKSSIKILYSWDSLKVFPHTLEVYDYFDKVFSFDKCDTEEHQEIQFLPLFYCDDLYDKQMDDDIMYDFSFVGFGHTDRYHFIKAIENICKREGYNYIFKLYLPSKLHYLRGKYITKIFSEARMKDFIFIPLSQEEIRQITDHTRIVLDLELTSQSGLTMRTIETHGMRKKLITTNQHIKEYDFYNENNILVVDRKHPDIPRSFIESDYQELPEDIYTKYSLSSWIETIFT